MSGPRSATAVVLARRPSGEPTPSDFELRQLPLPAPGPGEVLIVNEVLSLDPYMRPRMNGVASYVPPYRVGEPLTGGAVGHVVDTRDPKVPLGARVLHDAGWRDAAVLRGEAVRVVGDEHDPASFLGVLGMPGLTAYAGLFEIGSFRQGDAVFVSSAAGAVGLLAGQFAKLAGASVVVGTAGNADKVEYLTTLAGFDHALDHHAGPVREWLPEVCPDGLDLYFDNVGGEQLRDALLRMNRYGRVVLCGAISEYNATTTGRLPGSLSLAISRSLTLRGFIVSDYHHLFGRFLEQVGGWLAAGRLVTPLSEIHTLDNMVTGFIDMLRGAPGVGKTVVRL